MTDFSKANMDGSLEREFDNYKPYRHTGKRNRDYTVEVVDENMNVLWSGIVSNARGSKNARDLWRNQYPEIRERFIGTGCMVRVR
jgi:uncharacterized protein (DUF2225 family)